jgi:hypothetical protein
MTEETALPVISPIEVNRRDLLIRIEYQGEDNVLRIKPVILSAVFWKHFKISFGDIRWKRYCTLRRIVKSAKGPKLYFEKEKCPYPFTDYTIEFGWMQKAFTRGHFEFFKLYHNNELIHEIVF